MLLIRIFRCIYICHTSFEVGELLLDLNMTYLVRNILPLGNSVPTSCNQYEKCWPIMTSTFQMWRRVSRPQPQPVQSGLSSSFPSLHRDDKRGATALGSPTQPSPSSQLTKTNRPLLLDHLTATFQISKSDRGRINEPRLRAGSSHCPFTL